MAGIRQLTSREEMEKDAEEMARFLGGGWRIVQGIMPNIVLTPTAARRIIERLGGIPIARFRTHVGTRHYCPELPKDEPWFQMVVYYYTPMTRPPEWMKLDNAR